MKVFLSSTAQDLVAYRQVADDTVLRLSQQSVAMERFGPLPGTPVEECEELRALELERFDQMIAGLWPLIEKGNPPAVSAAVRVSERRSRLLGLDAPVVTKSELTGSLGVYADRLAADRELFIQLDVQQLEVLAAESQALIDKAMAMVRANALMRGAATAPRALVGAGESNGDPVETPTKIEVVDSD